MEVFGVTGISPPAHEVIHLEADAKHVEAARFTNNRGEEVVHFVDLRAFVNVRPCKIVAFVI